MRHFWKIELLFNLFKCKHYIVMSLQIFKFLKLLLIFKFPGAEKKKSNTPTMIFTVN